MAHRTKLVYAAGPGNVIGTFMHWKEGREDPSQVSRTYSGQFYDLVRDLDAQALVIASHPSGDTFLDGDFRIEHRPTPFKYSGGIRFHIGQLFSTLRVIWKAWRFRAHALIVSGDSGHWFPLRIAPLVGIKVIPTLHCVLWPQCKKLNRVQRFFNGLARPFFTRSASQILSISATVTRQLEELTCQKNLQVRAFLPSYLPDQFALVEPPSKQRVPFRVLFAGRIERNKGVFDLLEIAKRFHDANRTEIEFDLAGDGSSLSDLKLAISNAGHSVAERFRVHGHLQKEQMRNLFSRSHVVIVPTTSDFVEGFNKVVAEGVLSGRPVITSTVCPALEYVQGAVVEVPPDNLQAYGDAILQLCDHETFYEQKIASCRHVQEQFYDSRRAWGTALKAALKAAGVP